MPNAPTPKLHDVAIECNDADVFGVDFHIPPEVAEDFASRLTDLPGWLDFLKPVADWCVGQISGAADTERAIKNVLGRVELTEHLTFTVAGDCDALDAMAIESASRRTSGATDGLLAGIETRLDPGPTRVEPCTRDGRTGTRKTRLFTLSWYVNASFRGSDHSWLAQVDKIYVSSCCCAGEGGGRRRASEKSAGEVATAPQGAGQNRPRARKKPSKK